PAAPHTQPRPLHDALPISLHEASVQKRERLLRQYAHIGGSRGVECPGLEDFDGPEVAGVERRIYGGGEPDEATPRPLPEREAQLDRKSTRLNSSHGSTSYA